MFPAKNILSRCYLACMLAFAVTSGCAPGTGPEEAVRQWVQEAEDAIEARERGVLEDMIAAGYADARGNEKADIEQMLRVWFLRSSNVVLVSKIDEVTVFDDSAAIVLLTAATAGTGQGMFGLDADALRFELELEATGDEWLLIGARWGRPGEDLR